MTTYVMVAGAGLGGWVWQDLRRELESEGHAVYTPTLTGEGERVHLLTSDVDLSTHVTDVSQVLFYEDLNDVVLVGHSYGGVVITGTADRVPDRVGKLVYVDAPMGLSHLEQFPGVTDPNQFPRQIIDGVEVVAVPNAGLVAFYGITDPAKAAWTLERMTPHPWKASEQRLELQNSPALMPRYHIVAARTVEMGVHDSLPPEERVAGKYFEIDGPHALMMTNTGDVARALATISSS